MKFAKTCIALAAIIAPGSLQGAWPSNTMSDGARVIFLSVLAIAALASFNLENVAWPAEASKSDAAMEDRVRALIPDIEAYIVSGMKGFDVPGLAIGIVANDRLVYAKGFGVRSKSSGLPVHTRTIFQIGSTTKAFLAATEAIMVDRGKLRWDDRVVDLDPEFQLKDPWVTREFRVFDLLAQRSSLPPFVNDMLAMYDFKEAEMIRSLRYVEPVSSFRTTFAYTNITHLLASRIVAKAADAPDWNAVLQKELLDPLGMKDSTYTVEGIQAAARPCQRLPLDTGRLDRGAFHTDFSLSPGRGGRHQHQRRGYGALDPVAARQWRLRGTPHRLGGEPRLYAQTNGGGQRPGVLRPGLVRLSDAERQQPLARWRRAELRLLCRLGS